MPSIAAPFFKELVRPTLILAFLSILTGLAINSLRPQGALPLNYRPGQTPPMVAIAEITDPSELTRLLALPGAILLDARDPILYGLGHIPGALSLPTEELPTRLEPFLAQAKARQAAGPIIAYCSEPLCPLAGRRAEALVSSGLENVHLFSPGFDGWADLGWPVEK